MTDDTNTTHGYDGRILEAQLQDRWQEKTDARIEAARRGAAALGLTDANRQNDYVERSGMSDIEVVDSLRRHTEARDRQGGMTPDAAAAALAAMKKDPEAVAAYGNVQHPKHREVLQRHHDLTEIAYPAAGR